MRPIRIELEGFSAYRGRVEVDLGPVVSSDMPLFSLSGPTGAGKSSLIDAMIFALYGRIPRLGAKEVAPVISAGTDRARVRLDFEVEGVLHTAVRLATRTASGGATIKEARLERGQEVLASGADKVTQAVEELLHLGFEDFTRTVVLPQGDFARFLNATKSERQSLLRGILGLETYGRVRELATNRQTAAAARVETARSRLDAILIPDDAALIAARVRVAALEEMRTAIAGREKELALIGTESDQAKGEVTRLENALERLGGIAAPEDLEELGGMVDQARSEVADAEEAHEAGAVAVREVEGLLASGHDPQALAVLRRAHDELVEARSELDTLDPFPARNLVNAAEARLGEAKEKVGALRTRLEDTRSSHAAHALASTLMVGEPCPVCRHPVEALPATSTPAGLSKTEAELEGALARLDDEQGALDAARASLTEIETKRAGLGTRIEELAKAVEPVPDPEVLTRLEMESEQLRSRLSEARQQIELMTERVTIGRRRLEELAAREHAAGRLLKSALLAVADLDPPVSESDDIVVQWKDLMSWRGTTADHVQGELAAASERVSGVDARHKALREGLVDEMETMGVAPVEPFTATLATELERARHVVIEQERAITDTKALQAEIEEAIVTAAVAGALAGHLKSDGFERWMMAGALETLVAGANGLLDQLSDGGYSLHSEDGSFSIIDHRNADEKRSVSTLSGGETFLVSLALALSLAETLASSGGARLDAIILDEGFGTLDDESLDTVATVLEELAGGGLMVGVITHVKELAARAASRYEVTRGVRGSTVREAV